MTLTPDQITKSREEFEDYASQPDKYSDYNFSTFTMSSGSVVYNCPATRSLFDMWLARQESLVVELPKIELCFGKIPFSYVLADQMVNNLQFAGINYKEKD